MYYLYNTSTSYVFFIIIIHTTFKHKQNTPTIQVSRSCERVSFQGAEAAATTVTQIYELPELNLDKKTRESMCHLLVVCIYY